MKPDAQPKSCKARPVPYALQEAVDAEYHRLESKGIVEKVEFSEWATPMVHVPKADGTTLQTDHKPLLKIFAPDPATPVLAAACLQCWSLLLSSYQYEIEFKLKSPADALSRLPLQNRKDASVKDNIFQVPVVQ